MEENKKTDLIFVEGIRFFKPRENAPKSIKGNVVLNLNELAEFATKQQVDLQADQPLRIDLRKSETKGTYYFTLNTWKPTKKENEEPTVDIDSPF